MANEITIVGANGRDIELLMLFPIATPAEDASNTPVAPTPAATLPAVADAVLTQGEKDALDAGTAFFQIIVIHAEQGMTGAQILAAAQAKYATNLAAATARYAATYEFLPRVGQRFDAV